MFNRSDQNIYNSDRQEFKVEQPIDQQQFEQFFHYDTSLFHQIQMPLFNKQFIRVQQMPSFINQQNLQQQQQYLLQNQPQQISTLAMNNNSKQYKNMDEDNDIKFKANGYTLQRTKKGPKANLKNTYINKIQGLMNEKKINKIPLALSAQAYHHNNSKDIKSNKLQYMVEEKTNFKSTKLERNRLCAKNSRKRKKTYIQLLESKLLSIKEELKLVKEDTKQISSRYNDQTDFYLKNDKTILTPPEEYRNNPIMDDDSRVRIVKLLYSQMINVNLPDHLKCFLSINNDRTFKINKEEEFNFQELELNQLQQDQIAQLIFNSQLKKQNLLEQANLMKRIVTQLLGEYDQITGIIPSIKQSLGDQNFEKILSFFDLHKDAYDYETIFQTFMANVEN